MTLFEFRCTHCSLTFEAFRRFPACPQCKHSDNVTRVLTAPHLHGSANMPNG